VALQLLNVYKGYKIGPVAELDYARKKWRSRAVVSRGMPYEHHTVYGSHPYETQDEAILDAVDLGIEWIDQESTAKSRTRINLLRFS
jgi:hypothetical protein